MLRSYLLSVTSPQGGELLLFQSQYEYVYLNYNKTRIIPSYTSPAMMLFGVKVVKKRKEITLTTKKGLLELT